MTRLRSKFAMEKEERTIGTDDDVVITIKLLEEAVQAIMKA